MRPDLTDFDHLLAEVAGNFDKLANMFQQAINAEAMDGASLEALMRAKAAAENGAALARRIVRA
jgi:hypothetical protein